MPTDYLFDTSRISAQKTFMESVAPDLLYSGSFGAGKSKVGCEKGYFLSAKYNNNVGAIIRKTFSSLRITTMVTWERDVCPPSHIADFNHQTSICTLTNGSKIHFIGIDDPLKLGSLELGWAFVDEGIELDEDDYRMIQGRLRLLAVPFRQLFIATNPGAPSHYLHKYFYDLNKGEYVESNSLDNPFLPQDYLDRLAEFTGRYKDRYVLGKWVGYEGLVYDNWDPKLHLVEPFEIPEDWEIYLAIDFGYTNPFVCQWWAKAKLPEIGPDGVPSHPYKGFYLFREIYMSGRTVEAHAEQMKRYPMRAVARFSDWASGDRASLEKCGFATIKANKEINTGVQTIYRAIDSGNLHVFKNALVEVDERLKESGKPTCTAEEFGSYEWQKSPHSTNEKETPRDSNNHGMDASRYLFHTLEYGTSTQRVVVGKRPEAVPGTSRMWGQLLSPNRRWTDELTESRKWSTS